jgi:hydroxymethylglutaryl-CoA lyase
VAARIPLSQIALHFHDTRGTALANVLAALPLGVTTFDASCGGLGGCPYAPGASGNLATEDLVFMLDGLGIETGVRLDALLAASEFIESRVGHPLSSRYFQASKAARRS